MFNKLLERQILKFYGSIDDIPLKHLEFLKIISESYDHGERDRSMLERAIEISSGELIDLNNKLRKETIELKKTHAELNTLFENIDDVFFSVDMADGYRLLQMSQGCQKMYGYAVNEFHERPNLWFDVILDEDKSIIEKNYPALNAGKRIKQEYRIFHTDKSIRFIETKITPTLNENGKLIRIDGLSTDITQRKKIEKQIEDDHRNSEALINSTTDLMWSIGIDNKLIKANKAFIALMRHISGVTFKPGDDLSVIPGMDTEQINKWLPYYTKAFNGESLVFEEHNVFDGIELWNEISMQPIYENKIVTGVSCFSRNISESKRSLQIIKQSEEMMAEAQRIAHFGSWELSLIETENNSLNTLRWSDEVFRIFGYEPGQYEATLMNFFNAVHPDDRVQVANALEKALKENSRYHIEHRVIRPDGEIRWVRENGKIIVAEKTYIPQKMIGTVQDITNRKKAQLAQENAEANLRNILENTDTAYVLLDTDLTILSFNQLAKELSQQQISTTIREGLNYIDIIPENRKVDVKIKAEALLTQQKKISYETVYQTKKGEELWLFISMNPIFHEDGSLLGLSIAARNITERKLLEIEKTRITNDITQRNKDLEQFTYIVSHNLRSPVASILGLSILLDTPGIDEKTRKECFKGFVSSVKNLDNTIIDLNYILQARKEISEKKELVGFSDIVNSIKESISNLIAKEDVKINIDFSHIDEMYTLKSYLYSIFYNLISNSIKYRKQDEAPVIDITSKRIDKKIVIVFNDNCIGIDMKEHGNNIFGLYKRFHLNVEGKGMGLYMVKTQVETLGGKVALKSEVNRGTEITLEFEV